MNLCCIRDHVLNLRKLVHPHDHLYTELSRILDVFCKIFATFLEDIKVLLRVRLMQGFARSYIWSPTMHLQRTRRCNDHDGVRFQAAYSALDVAEFLHPHIGTKPAFRQYVADALRSVAFLSPSQLKGDLVSYD